MSLTSACSDSWIVAYLSDSDWLSCGPVSKSVKGWMIPDDLREGWESHYVNGVDVSEHALIRLPVLISDWEMCLGWSADFTVGMRTRGNEAVGELIIPWDEEWSALSWMTFFMRESRKFLCLGLLTGDWTCCVAEFACIFWKWYDTQCENVNSASSGGFNLIDFNFKF